ncbi:MAG: phosphoribosylamine--glycine ligase [Chloroflexi bacterium]|nr:phosphoribosylamine--glycine ligase [Chloroflexota bacterium]MYD64569.1 phosphoribosylamine--glycine ligase [Chloroflexota bacterium]
MSTNVLLLGSGGREHAIAWKLAQSPDLGALTSAPGNAGTAQYGENLDALDIDNPQAVVEAAASVRADLVVIGPEAPLARGVADALTAEGVPVFGPSMSAAEIEWSKAFAKELMAEAGIATGRAAMFEDFDMAVAFAHSRGGSCVVKADGLAAGKGVVVCDTTDEAIAAIEASMMDRAFGDAGARVLIEERLHGPETSAHAFTDGTTVAHMPFSCDHKPVFDGDEGPNTGGMGVYSPPGWLTDDDASRIEREVTERAVAALAASGREYRGALYPGMMLTSSGPKVIEFNCRLGDPEAEALLPRLTSDLLAICDGVAHGRLAEVPVEWDDDATVGVVMASGGYPGSYETGQPITGVEDVDEDVQVFLAGARLDADGTLQTAGGRVLCVVAKAPTLGEARERAYDNVRRIDFEGAHYRTDIAAPARVASGQGL